VAGFLSGCMTLSSSASSAPAAAVALRAGTAEGQARMLAVNAEQAGLTVITGLEKAAAADGGRVRGRTDDTVKRREAGTWHP
jgi:hypothetical protein